NVSHGTILKKSVLFKIHGAFVIIVFIPFQRRFMIKFAHISLKDFNKKYNPQEPKKETIENFEKEINSLLEKASKQDSEEFQ
ncbi:hypothetical protein, partial [Proteus vulgaris]|uniref:hypothetical protein n=1 Tax=Proteus vulgaris TaxID=585 RepID=UPI0025547C52